MYAHFAENYPEFIYSLNANGCIKSSDYIFIYSILLHNVNVRQPCHQLTQSCVEQHSFSQFLGQSQNAEILTRQVLHLIILSISTDEPDINDQSNSSKIINNSLATEDEDDIDDTLQVWTDRNLCFSAEWQNEQFEIRVS